MKRALIFCAGEGTRWKATAPPGTPRKHFVKIDGEALIRRTVRQFHGVGFQCLIISGDNAFRGIANAPAIEPQNSRWLVDTILSTRELWTDETVLVFGDVCFTDEAVKIIAKDEPSFYDLVWCGRKGNCSYGHGEEVFAIKLNGNTERFSRLCEFVSFQADKEDETWVTGGVWPVWDLAANSKWVEINDLTTDFDDWDSYQKWEAYRKSLTLLRDTVAAQDEYHKKEKDAREFSPDIHAMPELTNLSDEKSDLYLDLSKVAAVYGWLKDEDVHPTREHRVTVHLNGGGHFEVIGKAQCAKLLKALKLK